MKNILRMVAILSILLLTLAHSFAQESNPLQDLLDENLSPDDTAVVVLIDVEGETLTGAIGLANLETGEPATVEDRFRIGSITKTFTGTEVLLLQEDGLLNIDDPISQYLPADMVANIANGDEITIRQLLTMTSGIFDYIESDAYEDFVFENPDHIWKAAETIEFVYGEEPYFAPGEGYYYSNSNFNLLQVIIEAVTGNSLSDEFENRIFQPLGMVNTDLESNGIADGITRGYSDLDEDGTLEDITDVNDSLGTGDGGIVSTLADMALFGNALFREGNLLSDESWAEMTDWIDDDEGGYYGLGLSLSEGDDGEIWGHSGATAGFLGEFWYDVENDALVIAFSNNFDFEDLGGSLYEALAELDLE